MDQTLISPNQTTRIALLAENEIIMSKQAFIEKVDELCALLEEIIGQFKKYGTAFGDLDPTPFEFAILLFRERLAPQLSEGFDAHPVAAFWGGTNTGKSTLVNSIYREVVSPSGSTAGFTKRLIAVGNPARLNGLVGSRKSWVKLNQLPDDSFLTPDKILFCPVVPEETTKRVFELPVLIDTPDIDSSNTNSGKQAYLALELADIAVWVTTSQKYKDKVGLDFLETVMNLGIPRIDVFNQTMPRHSEAIEDLRNEYDKRWPENERFFILVDECVVSNELIPEVAVEQLSEKLKTLSKDFAKRRYSAGLHALRKSAGSLLQTLEIFSERKKACEKLLTQINTLLDESLYGPLRRLPGHEMPFELQSAMLRVIGPRLRSTIGDFLSSGIGLATQVLSSFFSTVTGRKNGNYESVDAIKERDKIDIETAVNIIDSAGHNLYEKIRNKVAKGGPSLINRLHSSLKKSELPDRKVLLEELMTLYAEKKKETVNPIISRFEENLEKFCTENPLMIETIKYAVPGISALASLAAAVFSIHSLAILPGVTEYFLGVVAVPIYRKLEDSLPEGFMNLAQNIGKEAFIKKARNEFIKSRRAIFVEAGNRVVKPIEEILATGGNTRDEIEILLRELESEWISPNVGN
ncbi:MAG: 50S ribosome-binding GTPase [Candidatus Riflebacteria bacterium]|nr:50S ribosome-binding GTPase [Candidatus Riflebacteria bacterium]